MTKQLDEFNKNDRVHIVTIILREMSADFLDKYMELCRNRGINLDEEFKVSGQMSFDDDFGYTSAETYYRILNDKEAENVREFTRGLKKANVRRLQHDAGEDGST